jgi:hypothetical protein
LHRSSYSGSGSVVCLQGYSAIGESALPGPAIRRRAEKLCFLVSWRSISGCTKKCPCVVRNWRPGAIRCIFRVSGDRCHQRHSARSLRGLPVPQGRAVLGVCLAVLRLDSARSVPGWTCVALVALTAVTALISSLGLVPEYRLMRLEGRDAGQKRRIADGYEAHPTDAQDCPGASCERASPRKTER